MQHILVSFAGKSRAEISLPVYLAARNAARVPQPLTPSKKTRLSACTWDQAEYIARHSGGFSLERTGGRVAEGARLERVYTGNRIEGSNPSLSAIFSTYTDFAAGSGECLSWLPVPAVFFLQEKWTCRLWKRCGAARYFCGTIRRGTRKTQSRHWPGIGPASPRAVPGRTALQQNLCSLTFCPIRLAHPM